MNIVLLFKLGIGHGRETKNKEVYSVMITLPITQLQLVLSMMMAEIWLISDPQYTVVIGSEHYFSLAVGGVIGMFFVFLFFAIKFGHSFQFKEEKVSLGKAASSPVIQKRI